MFLKIDISRIEGIDEEYASFIGLDLTKTLTYEMMLHGIRIASLNKWERETVNYKEIFEKKACKFHSFS